MRSRPKHWRRATTGSILLHLLLVLVAWWLARPGPSVVHVWWFDELAHAMAGPGYAPAELIPIELPERSVAQVSMPKSWIDEPTRPEAAQPSEAPARRRDRTQPKGDPAPGSGTLLRGRDELAHAEGLAGGGEHRAPNPDLLRGSSALLAASLPGGAVESPRRPSDHGSSNDYTFVREGGKWVYRDPGGSFVATLQPDGGVAFRNHLVDLSVVASPGLGGTGEHFVNLKVEYDPVGVARLSRGKDPSPRTKALLLAATFEMRLEVATKYHKERLLEQLNGIGDELDAIWNRPLSVAERKRLLFELWDGCEEPGGEFPGFKTADASALDETRRKYAKAARQKILRFIRSVAPAEGPDAYTETELAAFNKQRVSEQRFSPYDS